MNSWAQGEGQPGLGYIFWRKQSLPDEALNNPSHQLFQLAEQQILADEQRRQPASGNSPSYIRYSPPQSYLTAESNEYYEGAGPVAKNIGAEGSEALREQLGLGAGDAVFFVAGVPKKFVDFTGAARDRIGTELELIDENAFALAWVVDFPMYEWDEEAKKVEFSHNPFSMPQGGLEALESKDPLTIDAFQYDIICNGFEIGSGAIRNHRPEIMKKAFAIAGYGEDVLEAKFGGMLRALQFGAPPHGGMAAGLDRIVMLLAGAKNLREVTMFPMNQQAEDLLMGAPSEVTPQQLRELGIRLAPRGDS
jgi:aspartyl-tRNA synthetase